MLTSDPLPGSFVVRSMSLADIDAALEIQRIGYPTVDQREQLIRELNSNEHATYLTISTKDNLIGYGGYWLRGTEMDIMIILIHPTWRRQHLGELLLIHLLHSGIKKGATIAMLEVRESNIAAQSLYTKYGFSIVGRRKRYYRNNGEDALLMDSPTLTDKYTQQLRQRVKQLTARLTAASDDLPVYK